MVGTCHLSVLDVFEAMESGSCMCLGLEVERSEACIADPSMLKIKEIVPGFMTAEAFIDSAVFNLKKNDEAHGGFSQGTSKKGGAGLATGAARQSINAVMPLYLFKEHWEIARRRSPPIYGLSVTADVMGFAPAQLVTIPFKVLLKALEVA